MNLVVIFVSEETLVDDLKHQELDKERWHSLQVVTVSTAPSGICTCPSQPCLCVRPISNMYSLSGRIIRATRFSIILAGVNWVQMTWIGLGLTLCTGRASVQAGRVRAAGSQRPHPSPSTQQLRALAAHCQACLRSTPGCFQWLYLSICQTDSLHCWVSEERPSGIHKAFSQVLSEHSFEFHVNPSAGKTLIYTEYYCTQ